MLVFGKGLLGDTNAQAIICPVFDDLMFEMKHTRSLKHYLATKLDFPFHKKEIRLRYMDVGEYYHYITPKELQMPFSSIYYLMVRSFLKKPYFLLLQHSIEKILLNILEEKKKSVTITLFGIDSFQTETEISIIKESILNVYRQNKSIEQLQIYILGIPRELFTIATQIFSELPESIYSQGFRTSYRDRDRQRHLELQEEF